MTPIKPHPVAHIAIGEDSEDVFTSQQMQAYAEDYAREALRAQIESVPVGEVYSISMGRGEDAYACVADVEAMAIATEALEKIALAGMSGTGQESDEAMTEWHARQAWKFIGIAARAKSAIDALAAKRS